MLENPSNKLLIRLPNEHVLNLRMAQPQAVVPGNTLSSVVGSGSVEPLFPETTIQFVGANNDWLVYKPSAQTALKPWDQAHEQAQAMIQGANGLTATPDVYVEPDLIHRRRTGDEDNASPEFLSGTEPIVAPLAGPPYPPTEPTNENYPPANSASFSPAWHLAKSGFPEAWKTSMGKGVRVAHLDIGYWSKHYSTPKNIAPDAGYNFCEDNTDTQDPGKGPNAGHGTATMALLAGNKVALTRSATAKDPNAIYEGFIGGAPEAEVVPVRIAGVLGSVVYLYGETMAKGLSYALEPSDGKACDVISLSHGGLPMKSWAYAINALYEAGIVVVAASGDSYYAVVMDIATHFTVYPSAFYRVVTATGVTYDGGPYKRDKLGVMQGCWGPSGVMKKAVGGYTPNVAWMKYESQHDWELNGGGTSASTPQIAAACALWLATYGSKFKKGWQRVAACRAALTLSVADPDTNLETIGRGRLNVAAMLAPELASRISEMAAQNKLQKIEPDIVSFPLFRLLFGLNPPGSGIEEMHEVEALQLLYTAKDQSLTDAVEMNERGYQFSSAELRTLQQKLIAHPDISNALKTYLTAKATP